MSYFIWDANLDVGISSMNEDHKHLIGLMNMLQISIESHAELETLRGGLSELYDFTKKHFSSEETYLESIKYKELDAHRAQHRKLLATLSHHYNTLVNEGMVLQDLLPFLKNWLRQHIQETDMRYSPLKIKK